MFPISDDLWAAPRRHAFYDASSVNKITSTSLPISLFNKSNNRFGCSPPGCRPWASPSYSRDRVGSLYTLGLAATGPGSDLTCVLVGLVAPVLVRTTCDLGEGQRPTMVPHDAPQPGFSTALLSGNSRRSHPNRILRVRRAVALDPANQEQLAR